MASKSLVRDAIAGMFKEWGGNLNGTFQLILNTDEGKPADQWYLSVSTRPPLGVTVQQGKASRRPDVTITVSDSAFMRLATGETSGAAAFMKGELSLRGNIMLAQRAESLFRQHGGAGIAKLVALRQRSKL